MTSRADFPFYNDQPVAIGGWGWAFLMLSLVAAFVTLVAIPAAAFPATVVPAVLFVSIPILTLRQTVGQHWTALFGPVGLKQIGQMVVFACLTIVASMAVALVVRSVGSVVPNPADTAMKVMSGPDFILRLIPTLPQLVGEELMTILPFLALLWLLTGRLKLSRTAAILIALMGSCLLFGAAHLPTYDWHLAQSFGVIGTARAVLTLSYIWSRNLWVSAGAHILNDWSEFAFVFILSHRPIGAE